MAENEPQPREAAAPAAENNISPEEASKTLVTGAAMLQRAWLQAAVNIGQAISRQQPISHGAFEDLRRVRQQFEELDRANTAISRIAEAAAKMKSTETPET